MHCSTVNVRQVALQCTTSVYVLVSELYRVCRAVYHIALACCSSFINRGWCAVQHCACSRGFAAQACALHKTQSVRQNCTYADLSQRSAVQLMQ
eukprot:19446-Heterococcus_DN1.PRE.3